jgi:CHAT domain-containing protein/Tfp pilus assembly protein PilF
MSKRFLRQILINLSCQILVTGLLTTTLSATPRKTFQVNRRSHAMQRDRDVSLEVGKEIERELKADEKHLYRITLMAGWYLHVVVDQRGIDVVVVLLGPDGKQIVEVDSPNAADGPETLLSIAAVSGDYRLEVRSLERDVSPGRYRVKIEELRVSTDLDMNRIAAHQLSSQAGLLQAQGKAESLRESLEIYQKALPLYRAAGDRVGEARTLNNLGLLSNYLGENEKALDYFSQGLLLTRAIKNHFSEGVSLNNIGRVYYELGQKQKALESFTQALSLFRTMGSVSGEASTLSNLGAVYDDLGRKKDALDSFAQALSLHRDLKDRHGEATTLNNLGKVYDFLGATKEALESFEQALALHRSVGDLHSEAVTLSNIGAVYSSLGDKDKALDYYEKALPIYRSFGDLIGQAVTLSNIGAVHSWLGEKRKALNYYEQTLPMYRAAGDRSGEATTLNNVGAVYDDLGEKQKALEYFSQALSLRRAVKDRSGEAVTLSNIGAVYSSLGEKQKALDYHNEALLIVKAVGDLKGEGNVLFAIGSIYEGSNDLSGALDYYLQAIATRERLRSTISSQETRFSFDEASADLYGRTVLIYIRMGQAHSAFNLTEKMRARNLLDQLAGMSPSTSNSTVTERAATLRQQITSLDRALREERVKPALKIDHNLIKELETQLASKRREYEVLIISERVANPEHASLHSAEVLTVPEVQKFLKADTTLLSYLVTSGKTIAFIISRDSFQAVELPVKESELFDMIREFRSFPTVKTWQRNKVESLHRSLVAPIKQYLKTPIMGIVPYGVLHYIPFSMLSDGSRYLDEEHTIFYLPSVSVLPYIRNNRKENESLLAVAYDRPKGLGPLPYVNSEVRAIAQTYRAQVLTRNAATEEKVLSLAGNYDILHLAAHYELNTESPLLSRIVFAPSKSADGFLEVREIYNLNLRKTDLVVLSASQTQLGKQTRGDDLIGLERAFIYAGAATVIGSLWNVDDEVTTLLMISFYKHLKKGMTKAEALRRAQAETRIKYPHPYYWAAFVLTGDPGQTQE